MQLVLDEFDAKVLVSGEPRECRDACLLHHLWLDLRMLDTTCMQKKVELWSDYTDVIVQLWMLTN